MRTLFTKKVIKNQLERERFLFSELKLDDAGDFKPAGGDSVENETMVYLEPRVDSFQSSSEAESKIDFDAVISQMRSEYEVRLKDEYQRGFRDAEKILREEFNNQLAEHIALFEQLLKSFYNEVESLRSKIEMFVVSLAVKIAEKIVKHEIEKNNDFVMNQVREAIRRVVGVEKIKVRINPEDEKIIRELKPELLQILDSSSEVIIESDPGIEKGGCIIESELGNVDARISTQFSLIENSLIESIG
ncbi:MAG: FliH/SctL family protein [Candidatus Kryptonium sp.]|nr:FliH/SctL family protein [Candidatus Kryptonium sp.]